MKEEWRDIPGFKRSYQASTDGRIRSLDRYVETGRGKSFRKGKVLKPRVNNRGYQRVNLSGKELLVHKLVAITFVPNYEFKLEVNHIDGDISNNSKENLEWVTRSENMKHAYANGLRNCVKGENGPNSKLTHDDVIEIRYLLSTKMKQKDIATLFGVHPNTISSIKNEKTWKKC